MKTNIPDVSKIEPTLIAHFRDLRFKAVVAAMTIKAAAALDKTK